MAAAVGAHAATFALVSHFHRGFAPRRARAAPAPASKPPIDVAATSMALARVALIDVERVDQIPGKPLEAVLGAGDQASFTRTHPRPAAGVDAVGQTAASAGGKSAGGSEVETGRLDDDELHQQTWNDPKRYRLARHRTGDRVRSPESIRRVPKPGWDERTRQRRLARDGEQRGHEGAHGVAASTHARRASDARWKDADPFYDAPARARVAQRQPGSSRIDRARLHTDRGSTSTEAERRGTVADNRSTAAASNETNPGLVELTRPRSGGTSSGVAGHRRGPGIARRGGTARGTAATRLAAELGPGHLTVHAWRQNPYFRRMYRRVDERVRYPKRLALRLEQGELVAQFQLYPDGRIGPVRLSKSSGYREFDRAVLGAIRRAAPFGAVPKSLLKGRRVITVQAPYTFSNPLIR